MTFASTSRSGFLLRPGEVFQSELSEEAYMSGNSQGVKRPYLGHKIILCNTLL